MLKRKHILVIAQYFYPEQFRINDICEEWIKKGYKVTVVTGIPNYPLGKYYKGYGLLKNRTEQYKNIDIIRIPIIPRGNNALMLLLNYISFVISGMFWTLCTKLKADYVFIYEVSPMTQALPGVWYSKKQKIPCYLYVMDLWPENVEYVTGINNKIVIAFINRIVDYIYRRCEIIFTSSKSFINAISNRGISDSKLKFWPQYAEDYYKPLSGVKCDQIPQDGILNIIFAGNIGFAQGLDILPETADILRKNEYKIRFNIVGDGRAKDSLIKLVKEKDVFDYFNFIDKQPAQKIPELISSCDISLICLSKSKVFEITLPAKLQSCMACAKPILVSADGEIQSVIQEADAGICANAADAQMLAQKIIDFMRMDSSRMETMSRNSIAYSKKYYNKKKLLSEIDQYFN